MNVLMYLIKEMSIIKKLLTITLSILMMGSIATGCGKKDVTVKDTPIQTNTTTTNSNVTKPAVTEKSSNVVVKPDTTKTTTTKAPAVVQKETYYGQWKINKQIAYGSVGIYSNDDVKKMIGKTITYSEVEAVYGTSTCKNPYYKKSSITSSNFETSNKMRFSTLGITTKSVDEVIVYTSSNLNNIWDSTGSVFYIKDQNTLILFDGGVYFELNRVTN